MLCVYYHRGCLVEFLPFSGNNKKETAASAAPTPAAGFPIEMYAPVRLFCGHIKHSRESNTAIWLKKLRSQKMKKAPTRSTTTTTGWFAVNTPTNGDVVGLLIAALFFPERKFSSRKPSAF